MKRLKRFRLKIGNLMQIMYFWGGPQSIMPKRNLIFYRFLAEISQLEKNDLDKSMVMDGKSKGFYQMY